MISKTILTLFGLGVSIRAPDRGLIEAQERADRAVARHADISLAACSAALDIIDAQQEDPRRAVLKRDAASLRETLIAVAERARGPNS